jgi:guanine nucleotide-binding protein G(I)/G(S)/G(T) subunit beta-1
MSNPLLAVSKAADIQSVSVDFAPRRHLKGHFGKIYAMHWAPDSKRIVSASQDGKLIIWNAQSTIKEYAIALRSSWVMTCAYHPNETMVAAGGLDNICSIYEIGTDPKNKVVVDGKPLYSLADHQGYLSCCRFMDDKNTNKLITSSGDATCRLWDMTKKFPEATFALHESDVMSVSINEANNNIFVSGSCDSEARVWDIRQSPKESALRYEAHESDINSVLFIPNGTAFATGSDDSWCKLWDLRSNKPLSQFQPQRTVYGCTCVTFSRTGRILFASYDEGEVQVWDTLTGALLNSNDNNRKKWKIVHDERVSCVSVSKDGQALCTASWDTNMRIWA